MRPRRAFAADGPRPADDLLQAGRCLRRAALLRRIRSSHRPTQGRALMRRRRQTLSLTEARRIALAAQGFAERRLLAGNDRRALRRLIERLGVLQIDSVNVLARAHTLPP